MAGSRLTRLGMESSEADVKYLEFSRAFRASSQHILLAKLVHMDLYMNMMETRKQTWALVRYKVPSGKGEREKRQKLLLQRFWYIFV